MTKALSITASGMVTAVGFNWASTATAVRAGVGNMTEANLWDPESGEYLDAGRVKLPHWWEGGGKLVELISPAIFQCLDAFDSTERQKIPVFIGVAPIDRPHRPALLDESLLYEVKHKLGIDLHPDSRVVPKGRVSFVSAIEECNRLIEGGGVTRCVIAGVESYVNRAIKNVYLDRRRLLTPINSNGFIPGEAGCAVLVEPAKSVDSGELLVEGFGYGEETGVIDSENPTRGEGLTKAIRTALSVAEKDFCDIDTWYTDQNGEHYKFKEITFAKIKLERIRNGIHKPSPKIHHPIEYLGDVGAAIGPCLMGLALHAHRQGYANGPLSLVQAGEDNGDRAALVINWSGKG